MTPLPNWIVFCQIFISFFKQLQLETYYFVIEPYSRLQYSHGLFLNKIHTVGDFTAGDL